MRGAAPVDGYDLLLRDRAGIEHSLVQPWGIFVHDQWYSHIDETAATPIPQPRSPSAALRALAVRSLYQRPESPQCPDVFGASAFSMNHNDKTDLVFGICFGPADPNSALYAVVGDCLTNGGPGPASRSSRIDCADPAAADEVIERHESPDNNCPSGTSSSITWTPAVTAGITICLARR